MIVNASVWPDEMINPCVSLAEKAICSSRSPLRRLTKSRTEQALNPCWLAFKLFFGWICTIKGWVVLESLLLAAVRSFCSRSPISEASD